MCKLFNHILKVTATIAGIVIVLNMKGPDCCIVVLREASAGPDVIREDGEVVGT